MPDPVAAMDVRAAVSELEALAEKLGVTVDYDHFTGDGMGSGGLCKVRGQWRLIVERQGSPGEKASVIARALSRFDLESHFISPAVRELIARASGTDAVGDQPADAAPDAAPAPIEAQPEPPPEPIEAQPDSGDDLAADIP